MTSKARLLADRLRGSQRDQDQEQAGEKSEKAAEATKIRVTRHEEKPGATISTTESG
jgi:hypothetical protein